MAEEETPQTTGTSKKRKIMQMSEHDIQNLVYNSEAVNTKKQTIDAMLLNLDPDIVRSDPRLHSTCSKQFSRFIVFLNNKIMIR